MVRSRERPPLCVTSRQNVVYCIQGSEFVFALLGAAGHGRGLLAATRNIALSAMFSLLLYATRTSGKLPSRVGRQYGTAVGCGGRLLFGGGQVRGSVLWGGYPCAHHRGWRYLLAVGCSAAGR